jgi:hypothetical protein
MNVIQLIKTDASRLVERLRASNSIAEAHKTDLLARELAHTEQQAKTSQLSTLLQAARIAAAEDSHRLKELTDTNARLVQQHAEQDAVSRLARSAHSTAIPAFIAFITATRVCVGVCVRACVRVFARVCARLCCICAFVHVHVQVQY